ncbi:peptidylprolyl isomerase [Bacillus thuringiensis]|uniref:peptidylprolyl isomerase n=1 Tax=Bacillus thuringiensis TaxID=1428 RepID=UPI0026E20EA8|nr:peptidylprolyl isomerase [Bacillus thuringiensis]MDO6633490.1 peptidylprolyl isomerase [Bacillus thuringiensis]MDO6662782.1 peptidylprolyl isomerase [Bacillus thuringiensis]MDO6703654.1 peptidylprolyl isomerase [Bacillus thuringiensis]
MSLTNLQKKKLQIELNPNNDKVLYNFVTRLEEQGKGQKGYVNKQIKKRLEMYQVLAEVAGEEDPLQLVKKLLININTHGIQNDAGEDEKPSEEVVDNAMDLLASLDKSFM